MSKFVQDEMEIDRCIDPPVRAARVETPSKAQPSKAPQTTGTLREQTKQQQHETNPKKKKKEEKEKVTLPIGFEPMTCRLTA